MQHYTGIDGLLIKVVSGVSLGAAGMMTADWSLAVFGVPISALLAAFGGSVIALSALPKMEPKRMAFAIVAGLAIGIYGSQLAVWAMGWPSQVLPPVAFFLGLFGQALISMLFKDGRDVVLALIRQKFGLPPANGSGQ